MALSVQGTKGQSQTEIGNRNEVREQEAFLIQPRQHIQDSDSGGRDRKACRTNRELVLGESHLRKELGMKILTG